MLIKRLSLALLCAVFAASAVAADIDSLIKQLPGNNYAATGKVCDEILKLGPDVIADLCGRLVPMGAGDDLAVRLALSGLTKAVTAPGSEDDRPVLVAGLVAGLDRQADPECKAFLMQQLQFAGDDTAVPALAQYLDDPALSDGAIMALTSIATGSAASALEAALDSSPNKENIQIALMEFPSLDAPVEVTPMNESVNGVALPALLVEAKALALAGKDRKAIRSAKKLLRTHVPPIVCTQVLDLLVSLEGKRAQDTLMDLMDHHSAECRAAALAHAATLLDKSSVRKWEKVQRKASPEVQAEIAAMLAAAPR